MADCLGCGEGFMAPSGEALAHDAKFGPCGLCPSCREALEIGRLVREMPEKCRLRSPNSSLKQKWEFWNYLECVKIEGGTPLEALKKGLKK